MSAIYQESPPDNIRLSEDGTHVIILDQTRLPKETVYLALSEPEELFEAVRSLRVRGAPAIGIFAAFGLACLAGTISAPDFEGFFSRFLYYKEAFAALRPTAVNLRWALDRMVQSALLHRDDGIGAIAGVLMEEAKKIQREDAVLCRSIAEHGLTLLQDGDGILTHCNAGPLATSRYGTALGPLILGKEQGRCFHVFADETRPLLQGTRLTAFELARVGIDVTLICDSAANAVMQQGWIQAVLVGCDRIAANGDVANKIGTSALAILAHHHHIPFYVLGPTSTLDLDCPSGRDIPIELRDPEEIRSGYFRQPMAPSVPCYNPAFDVTDHTLITGIVTEHGICRAPYTDSLRSLPKNADPCKKAAPKDGF